MKNKPLLVSVLIIRLLPALLLLLVSRAALAQDYVFAPDFQVGDLVPEIAAQDQNGDFRTFDELKGEKGMLFMMSRSFDW
jgi:hypothetical protein